MEKKQTLALIINNTMGVLNKVIELIGRRNVNIESMSIKNANNVYYMDITIYGTEKKINMLIEQFDKLIDLVKLSVV